MPARFSRWGKRLATSGIVGRLRGGLFAGCEPHFTAGKRCLCTVPNFPYESHVRHFKDAAEVAARYGPFLDGLDVMEFRSPRDPADRFFLMDGIRNAHRAEAG